MKSYVAWIGSERANCAMYAVFRASDDEDAQRNVTRLVAAHDAELSEQADTEIDDSTCFDFLRLGSQAREEKDFKGGGSADWEVAEEGGHRLVWTQKTGQTEAVEISVYGWANG